MKHHKLQKKPSNIPWSKSDQIFFYIAFLSPMIASFGWAMFGGSTININTWKFWFIGRILFSGLFILGNLHVFAKLLKTTAYSQATSIQHLKWIITPIIYIGIFWSILQPVNAFKDLNNGLKHYDGECQILSEVRTQNSFDNPRYFVLINDDKTQYKLRINSVTYIKIKSNEIGLNNHCATNIKIIYLANSKIAFYNN
ncbi:hypothetical protein KA089_01775 [Candidatus Woesebacteria bacterium]|nr:hypothetical protein [Candidatus Woesebacteria bacterium]